MACHTPLQAYRRPFGGVTFSQAQGTVPVKLPCGQCMGCRLDHAQAWAIRAVHESMMHEQNQFLTLTYSSEHLPKDLSLNHKHFQDFMKRYRKDRPGIRFLMCGEYGATGDRPHYHALIFGHEFADKTLWKDGKSKLYRSAMLEKLWPYGFSTIGEVNYKTASYVAGYIRKKLKGKAATEINPDTGLKAYELYNDETGEIIKRVPEYAQMSRRPGLGHDFYETYGEQIRNHDTCVINGSKLRVPKYYDRLTEKLSTNVYERNKNRRISRAKKHARNNTTERLAAREAYKLAVINKSHKRTEL